VMKLNATFDHRFIDGWHAAVMSRTLREAMEDPESIFGPPGTVELGPDQRVEEAG